MAGSAPEVRRLTRAWRVGGQSVGLVPTMGALHEGHLSLVRASNRENDRTVVSVFVNPLQFGPREDLSRYPRRLEEDLGLLGPGGAQHADAVYAPGVEEMYGPEGRASTRVRVLGLDEVLEGRARPGHLEGVATVVAKLFNAVAPDRAYFGRKDAQQLAVVTRLARELDTGVEVRPCPTVREPDGLAMSSRNAYLTGPERKAATCLFRALAAAQELHAADERDPARLALAMRRVLASEPLVTAVDYAELVDPDTFTPPGDLAVLAVQLRDTRLIDNHLLGFPLTPGRSPRGPSPDRVGGPPGPR
ncbi:MAG: pantoate--beta-alanine ligase [Candidatus Dormibacterales bacterium]